MKNRINLLLPKEKNISDRIIYFALNYLRYILVITQLCVIGVFFYRFKVDQQIIDLKDELEQKREIVMVSAPLIKEAEAIDIKVKAINGILTKQEATKQMLSYLFSIFPEKLKLDSLKINEDKILLVGVAEDPQILRVFNNRLKVENHFKIVELKNIKRGVNGFNFVFNLSSFH